MQKHMMILMGALALGVGSVHAQADFNHNSGPRAKSGSSTSVGFEVGAGYLEELSAAYFFGQIRWNVYEDAQFRHTFFGEVLGYQEDSDVEFGFRNGSSAIFDGDLTFVNLTLNYELGLKLNRYFELYVGGGAGVQFINQDIDGSFLGDNIDDDTRFVSQAFAGIRGNFNNGMGLRVGARRIFVEDFRILGDSFSTGDQWGFEAALTFNF